VATLEWTVGVWNFEQLLTSLLFKNDKQMHYYYTTLHCNTLGPVLVLCMPTWPRYTYYIIKMFNYHNSLCFFRKWW